MVEIQNKSCVFNISLFVLVASVMVSTVGCKNHAAETKDNPQIEKQLGCATLYVNDTLISQNMSEFHCSCLRITAPAGMGIHMDFLDVNSSWSIYDFFYIRQDQNCENNGIIAFTGNLQPCSISFNTSTLEIHFQASLMLNFSSFTIDSFPHGVCNVAQTVDQSQNSQPCTNLVSFDKVYNFTHKIIPYSELIRQHPSLDFTTFPDQLFQPSELPLLNLATTGRFLIIISLITKVLIYYFSF